MRYAIVIEESSRNDGTSVPSLPGCVATRASEAEAVRKIRAALQFHIESSCEHNEHLQERRFGASVVDPVALTDSEITSGRRPV